MGKVESSPTVCLLFDYQAYKRANKPIPEKGTHAENLEMCWEYIVDNLIIHDNVVKLYTRNIHLLFCPNIYVGVCTENWMMVDGVLPYLL